MNKKRHAILIIAHNNVDQLNQMLKVLDSDVCDIYLHIDRKSSIEKPQIEKLARSKIYVYKQMSVYWADYSQIACELFLMERAIKGDYCYYHLISGSDLPLKTPSEIVEALENKNDIYLHFTTAENVKQTLNYIKYYHVFQKQLCIVNRGKKISFIKIVNKLILQIQKLLNINRIPSDIILKKGANWFSMPGDATEYILSKKNWIHKTFFNTKSGDEFFVQTLLYNSDYKCRIYRLKEDDNYRSCLRQIDWQRGNPYVFRSKDYDALINSEMIFARKFEWQIDKDIIDRICLSLLKRKL